MRQGPSEAPNPLPSSNGPMTAQSRADFTANWDRQVGCAEQYEPAASDAVWSEMLASDPVGATWGAGVRRAGGADMGLQSGGCCPHADALPDDRGRSRQTSGA